MHGIMFSEAFLGPSQHPFRIQLLNDSSGRVVPSYLDTAAGEQSYRDPRLSSIIDEWEEVPTNENLPRATGSVHFRNRVAGKTMKSNPRFLLEVLSERGIKLEICTLV